MTNEQDFTRLFRRYRNMVRGIVYEYEKNNSVVPELVNQIFMIAWERRESYDGTRSEPQTWLGQIAHSTCKNYLRDEVERQPELVSESELGEEVDVSELEGDAWLDQHAYHLDDPESIAIAEEGIVLLPSELSQGEHDVWQAMYVDGLTAGETADLLGLAPSTVRTLVQRIRIKLSHM